MDLSIIIVNYNTKKLLGNCIASILKDKSKLSSEIIVIDNCSTDGSADFVAQNFPQVNLLLSEQNRGYSYACNLGLRQSKGDFICLLNADTEVETGALEKMMGFFQSHPGAGAVGPKVLNEDGTLQSSCRNFPSLFRTFCENIFLWESIRPNRILGTFLLRYWMHDKVREVDYVVGCCIMVKREVLDDTGFLDETFFMYSEEVDWCFRIRKAGWKIYFLPDAKIIHHKGKSTDPEEPRMFIELHKSAIRFVRKHYPKWKNPIFKLIWQIGLLQRTVIWLLI